MTPLRNIRHEDVHDSKVLLKPILSQTCFPCTNSFITCEDLRHVYENILTAVNGMAKTCPQYFNIMLSAPSGRNVLVEFIFDNPEQRAIN